MIDQCSSKMSLFPFCQGLFFSLSSQSITVLPPHPKCSISFWGRRKTFAEGRPRDQRRWGPVRAPWAGAPSQTPRSSLGPSPPTGAGGRCGKGLASPPSSPRPTAAGHRGASSPRSGWGRGPVRGPQMPLGPPSLAGAPTVSGSRRNQSG